MPNSAQTRLESLFAGLWVPSLIFGAWFGAVVGPNLFRNRISGRILKIVRGPFSSAANNSYGLLGSLRCSAVAAVGDARRPAALRETGVQMCIPNAYFADDCPAKYQHCKGMTDIRSLRGGIYGVPSGVLGKSTDAMLS